MARPFVRGLSEGEWIMALRFHEYGCVGQSWVCSPDFHLAKMMFAALTTQDERMQGIARSLNC